jgi:hypothetical protein
LAYLKDISAILELFPKSAKTHLILFDFLLIRLKTWQSLEYTDIRNVFFAPHHTYTTAAITSSVFAVAPYVFLALLAEKIIAVNANLALT